MPEHPNATKAREGLDALNSGDMQAMSDFLDDDVVWHEIGRPEPVRGKAALAAEAQQATGDYTITGKLHDVVANDDHTIALVDATATRGGKTLNYRTAEIMHIRNGKVVASFGAITRLTAWTDGKSLFVVTEMDAGVPDDVARKTISAFNRFLEAATGYASKDRKKQAEKSARAGPAETP